MGYEILATQIIGQAIKYIDDYLIFGDEDGAEALKWVKKRDQLFMLYADATCGPEKMKKLIDGRIVQVKSFIKYLEEIKVEVNDQNRRWIRHQWEKFVQGGLWKKWEKQYQN